MVKNYITQKKSHIKKIIINIKKIMVKKKIKKININYHHGIICNWTRIR
jgi:hypothetical protein